MFEREPAITHCERFHVPAFVVDQIERRIMRSYVQLIFEAQGTDLVWTVTVEQFGTLEVSLTELQRDGNSLSVPPFWLNAFSSDDRSSIDSLGVFEFNNTEMKLVVKLIVGSL